MALKIRFQYPTGAQLGYSIERLCDGLFYDFSTASFVASPATTTNPLPEDEGCFAGRYKMTMTATPAATFTDGDYAITIHDLANSSAVVAELAATMQAGDDASTIANAPTNPTILDAGFETPVLGAGQFQYNPNTGGSWNFFSLGSSTAVNAGISGNGSAFTSANPPASEGSQVGFIQNNGAISQTVPNWAPGRYAILFQAAQRNYGSTVQDLNILVDGNVVGTCTPVGIHLGSYYKTSSFTVTQGNHTISFVGLNSAKGDNTAFIDDIQIVRV